VARDAECVDDVEYAHARAHLRPDRVARRLRCTSVAINGPCHVQSPFSQRPPPLERSPDCTPTTHTTLPSKLSRTRSGTRPHTDRPARLVRSCRIAHRSPRLPSRRNRSSARRVGPRIAAGDEVGSDPRSNGKTVWALLGNEAADLQLAVGEHGG